MIISYFHCLAPGTIDNEAVENSADQSEPFDFDMTESHFSDEVVDQNWECAKFLLRVTEEHHLTHDGVGSLSDSVQWLVDSLFMQVTDKLKSQIPETVSQEEREAILKTCDPGDLFSELNSRYLREKYYKNHFNYVV